MFISCFPNKLADNVKKFIVQDKIQGVLPDALVKFMTAATRIHGAYTQLSGGRIKEEEAHPLLRSVPLRDNVARERYQLLNRDYTRNVPTFRK